MASSSSDFTEPSLDSLVGYLLAAKRSLSTVDTVSRANELVTSSKAAFVQQTTLVARTSYLRSGCTALYGHLAQMHSQLGSIALESAAEVDEVIADVSAAEKRLQSTLEGLRSTIVDSKLRPQGEEPKSLLDFVDRGATQGLLGEIHANIEETDKQRRHYDGIVEKFGKELRGIRLALVETQRSPSGSKGDIIARDAPQSRPQQHEPSPVPAILQTMEATAHEMAENLESLVKHYDLCLEVLRHTEGAGAALSTLAGRDDLPAEQNAAIASDIGRGMGPKIGGAAAPGQDMVGEQMADDFPEPGTEERANVMAMLAGDAAQVDEVVGEIHNSLAALGAAVEQVQAHGQLLHQRYACVRSAYAALEAAEGRLPHYSTQSHLHADRLDAARAELGERAASLAELARFYAGFLAAYDRLVIEVGRRKDVARRMRRVRDEAAALLEQLRREDADERDLFRRAHGDFLPRDIWPGLDAPPARYDLALVEGERSVPDISASVVQRAIRRVTARASPPQQYDASSTTATSATPAASATTATASSSTTTAAGGNTNSRRRSIRRSEDDE